MTSQHITAMIAKRAMPPTTPPAMAPAGVLLPLVEPAFVGVAELEIVELVKENAVDVAADEVLSDDDKDEDSEAFASSKPLPGTHDMARTFAFPYPGQNHFSAAEFRTRQCAPVRTSPIIPRQVVFAAEVPAVVKQVPRRIRTSRPWCFGERLRAIGTTATAGNVVL